MEEDIKILENVEGLFIKGKVLTDVSSLKNLIKGYRELEMENQSYRDYYGEPPCYDNAKYIPKTKIQEKIDELEKADKEIYIRFLESDRTNVNLSTEGKMTQGAIGVLKELLEDK